MDHSQHSKVISFPAEASSDVEVEAAHWCVRLNSGLVTNGDIVEHAMWLADSEEHDRIYRDVERCWRGVGAVNPPDKRKSGRSGGLVPARAQSGPKFGLIAAGLVMALGGVGLTRQYVLVWQHDYHTNAGEIRTVALADGSTLTLNGGAALDLDVSRTGPRVVRLARGEVFFDVTHDAARPFTVEAGSSVVKDLGTGFSVRRDGRSGSVSVDHGLVEVSAGGRTEVLTQGQTTRFGPHDLAQGQPIATSLIAPWRRGLYIADDRPLGEIIADLDDYRRGGVVVLDPALRQRRIGAVVKLGNLDAWLDTLGLTEGIKVQRWGPMVVIAATDGGRTPRSRADANAVKP